MSDQYPPPNVRQYTTPPMDWPQQPPRRKIDDDKIDAFLAWFPDVKAMEQFLVEHDKLVEEQKRRNWVFGSIKMAAMWMAGVSAGLLAFKSMFNDIWPR